MNPVDAPEIRSDARIRTRVFLVGCARSGTTLLQSLIATQAGVASFPETHFFPLAGNARLQRWCLRLGLLPPGMRRRGERAVRSFLAEIDRGDLAPPLRGSGPWVGAYVRACCDLLDRLGLERGADRWLEKTPSHLYVVDLLERHVPDVRFLHMLRSGPDVVASLYEVTRAFPEFWGGAYDIDRCIDRWKLDVGASRRHRGDPKHHLVEYEELVARPDEVVARACEFLEIDFDAERLAAYRERAGELTSPHESWKAHNRGAIRNRNATKFEHLFDAEQREYIRRRCAELR